MLNTIYRGTIFGMLLACGVISAQPLSCTVSTTQAIGRVEGITELLGDVIFKCFPGPQPVSSQSYVQGDVTITLNTNLTNRIGIAGDSLTIDAVLVINENNGTPVKDSTLGGPLKNVPLPQYGRLTAANQLKWSGVKIPNPGAAAPDGTLFPSRTTLRITSMRASLAQLGLSSTLIPTQVVLLSAGVADAARIEGVDGNQSLGAFIQQGLLVFVNRGELCGDRSLNITGGAVSGPPSFTIGLREGSPSDFRPIGQPSTSPGVPTGESGYASADQGTRFLLRFNNVNTAVRLAVPPTITNGTLTLQLVQGLNLAGSGPFKPITSAGLYELQVTAGSSEAVYEVTASDNAQIETVNIPVTVGFTADPAQGLPSYGTATVNASYAPLTVVGTASASAPVPRFADESVARNAFSIDNFCPAVPTITKLVPSVVPACSGNNLILGIGGSGFGFSSTAEVGGVPIFDTTPTSYDFTGLYATVPASMLTTPGVLPVDVTNDFISRSNVLPLTITGVQPGKPVIRDQGVVNGASFTNKLAKGSLGTIFGTNLACKSTNASTVPLPTNLGGVSVAIAGIPAPLVYVSPTQINFQVPFEVPVGAADILVTNSGSAGAVVKATIADYAVGIFTYARTAKELAPVIVHFTDNSLVTPTNPASPNEILVVYATGVGKLNNPPPTGSGASGLSTAVDMPAITVGGAPVKVLFAGLTPGFPGLAQFNIQLPTALQFGSLPLSVAFPNDASAPAQLAVQANAHSIPEISLSPTILAFGQVNVSQTKDLALAITNTGTGVLTVNSFQITGAGFSLVSGGGPFNLALGATQMVTVRFAPTAIGPATGTLTIASSDSASPSVTVPLTATGISASAPIVLQVDGGTFINTIGYPNGTNTAFFLNRLTPPSYPATLNSVQIYFGNRTDGLQANTAISIVEASNPSGSTAISQATAGVWKLVPATVGSLGGFSIYSVPAITINSGDFVVGFMVVNSPNVFPADEDQSTASQGRSYTSGDGVKFSIVDSFGASLAGNFGIRAAVTLGSKSQSPSAFPNQGPLLP